MRDARAELVARVSADPLWFARTVLKRKRWARQIEMRRSLDVNRYALIYSGNGVGKTHELASEVLEWLPMNPGGRVLCTGPTFDTVRSGLWASIRGAYQAANGATVIGGRMMDHEWHLGHEWDARIAAVDNPSALQGARGKRVLIVVDEAQGVDHEFYGALQSLMTAEGSRFIVIGNPLEPQGWFFEASQRPDMWHTIQISCLEHPNVVEGREVIEGAVTRKWIDERLREYGSEDDPRYVARVLGRFPRQGSSRQVISIDDLERAADGTVGVKDVRRMGVDISRQGGDSNVIAVFDETRTLVHVETWSEPDTMVTVDRIVTAMKEHNVEASNVKLDACGLGGPLVDRLAELGVAVDPVDFGSLPDYDWRDVTGETTQFKNRRAELYWVMRELLKRKQVSIPRQFSEVWRDLVAVNRKPSSADRGVILLEAKDDVRTKLGRSPDCGDAAVLALSNIGAWVPMASFV